MKIYVDELPKSCNACEFEYFYDCQYCTLRPDLMRKDEWCEKEKHCPLLSTQSLKQQVREEVVEEIIKAIDDKFNCLGYVEEKFEDIKKYILDQVKGKNHELQQ